jgi:hypothetical protein
VINQQLQRFIIAWNNHTISHAGKPIHLYSSVLTNPVDLNVPDMLAMMENYGVDDDSLVIEDNEDTVFVPDEENPLNEQETLRRDELVALYPQHNTNHVDRYYCYKLCTEQVIAERNTV